MSAPRTAEEARREELVDRELRRLAKARRNRIKRHPCPTCETSGQIRRSFGFAYAGDPQSEAFTFERCRTCDGDGALPAGRIPVRLRPGERAAKWFELYTLVKAEPVFDVEDLDLEAIAERVGVEVDELLEELGSVVVTRE